VPKKQKKHVGASAGRELGTKKNDYEGAHGLKQKNVEKNPAHSRAKGGG